MATLGIVEAAVFLIHQYFEVNLEKERIFADVHFTLFFVAIINALMGCIIYILAMQVAESRWVNMEALDTNHYVAIRAQFHQVQKQLRNLENPNNNNHHSTTTSMDKNDEFSTNDDTVVTNDRIVTLTQILGRNDMFKAVLRKKHTSLLVQLRFHDLRVHFIEKHNLPATFR